MGRWRGDGRDLPELERGSPEWSAAVGDILKRDRIEDVEVLCRLMGIEDETVRRNHLTRRKSPAGRSRRVKSSS